MEPETAQAGKGNPFKSKTALIRSPPVSSGIAESPKSISKGTGKENEIRPELRQQVQLALKGVKNPLQDLGVKIRDLAAKFNAQRHINQEMRDIVSVMVTLHEEATKMSKAGTTKKYELKDAGAQTEELAQKRRRDIDGALPSPKRKLGDSNPINTRVKDTVAGNWTVVKNKKKSTTVKDAENKEVKKGNHTNKRRARPPAILIAAAEGQSYADILRQMKSNPELKEAGEAVSKIRKTAKGELLIQLRSKTEGKSPEFSVAMQKVLQDTANVKSLCQHLFLELRDLDEITTHEDIVNAVVEQTSLKSFDKTAIKTLHKRRDGTQRAQIAVPIHEADQLLKVGYLRIGWVRSAVREFKEPIKCFKCLEFGHIAARCKSIEDRSGNCFRCGEKGHRAQHCKATPKCVLCQKSGLENVDHSTGSYKCPEYKMARKQLKAT